MARASTTVANSGHVVLYGVEQRAITPSPWECARLDEPLE
jgi:hypothetical protein